MNEEEMRLLFQKRDKAYDYHTNEIYEELHNVLLGINLYLGDELFVKTDWQGLQLYNDIITIVGFVPIEKDKVFDHDEIIYGSDEDPKRVIKIGIPLTLAMEGTAEDVRIFLQKSVEESQEHSYEDIEEVNEIMNTILNPDEDWDTEDLSEEQLEKLMMYERTNKEENEH